MGDETIETVVEVATGLYDTTYVVTTVYDEYQVCDTTYHYPSDVLTNVPERIRVTDPYTSMFCIGLRAYDNQNLGVWISRDVLNFNTTRHGFASPTRLPDGTAPRPSSLSRPATRRAT